MLILTLGKQASQNLTLRLEGNFYTPSVIICNLDKDVTILGINFIHTHKLAYCPEKQSFS
jgi:hypothetical protein